MGEHGGAQGLSGEKNDEKEVSGCKWWKSGEVKVASSTDGLRSWTVWCGPVTHSSREGRALSKSFSTHCLNSCSVCCTITGSPHALSTQWPLKSTPRYYHTGKSISRLLVGADRLQMGSLIYWSPEENRHITTRFPTKLLQGCVKWSRKKTTRQKNPHFFTLIKHLTLLLNINIVYILLNCLNLD